MVEIRVSVRYARAIMVAAQKLNLVDIIYEDLQYIVKNFQSSKELFVVFKSPVISGQKKKAILKDVFAGKINDLTFSLLDLIIAKNRESLVVSICKEYQAEYYKFKDMLPVSVTTAIDLDESTKNNVLNKINSMTGKSIVPEFIVEPKIKGGLKVQIDTWVYDSTIQNQLEQLYQRLTAN